MARNKNALRGHFIQAVTEGGPIESDWKELAVYISTITDETEEEIEEEAFYSGDGTPESDVISVAGAYGFEGYYDPADAAQAIIADMKYKVGDGRKLYHKVVSADGAKSWTGKATVTDIVAGGGEASEYEEFSCTIKFDEIPTEEEIVVEG